MRTSSTSNYENIFYPLMDGSGFLVPNCIFFAPLRRGVDGQKDKIVCGNEIFPSDEDKKGRTRRRIKGRDTKYLRWESTPCQLECYSFQSGMYALF